MKQTPLRFAQELLHAAKNDQFHYGQEVVKAQAKLEVIGRRIADLEDIVAKLKEEEEA